ncbi:glutamate synthase subunit beta [Actinocatenispora sera]|uniref:Dihydropyrimidine dehydrogenase subunit A n=1 Tax=Actinocatenispora sera TaxID=390989 RepID=A0A810L9Z1_9ACTN|nr:glutamate synthase subunit beta [Actinocatenispora sera]BCJ30868.1 dihydropyrimidine dehydrogenase subunit A [Actinocatenispora sera]
MPDPRGFLAHGRSLPAKRPVPVRIADWHEVYTNHDPAALRDQATRCMDCGVPFCHNGCPLGNRIPEWNEATRTGADATAIEQLHATNNFPEFTGRLCPAPCEAACVLGIADDPVTIKQIEVQIIDRAYDTGLVTPQPAPEPSGKRVAIVGSGPAGLAAAQQLARAGHEVVVYERDERVGGLLRFGIPDFKLEKKHIDRRLAQLTAEGVRFVTGCEVGVDVSAADLRAEYDAVLLATGALASRDVDTPGRELRGVHLAMEHLVAANRAVHSGRTSTLSAAGKHVVIIGGGDTAADCLGVAHRQGAASVTQLDLYPQPPAARDGALDPWPTWPTILRMYPAHEEGGAREFAAGAYEFVDDGTGTVRAIRIHQVDVARVDGRRVVTPVPGSERELPADLVLLAIGFAGTEPSPLLSRLGLTRSPRGTLDCGDDWQTDAEGVFTAGDAHRGAALIVWAIAEGRAAAAAIHRYLGVPGDLPAPVDATTQPLALPR